jgi:hypothetical protein
MDASYDQNASLLPVSSAHIMSMSGGMSPFIKATQNIIELKKKASNSDKDKLQTILNTMNKDDVNEDYLYTPNFLNIEKKYNIKSFNRRKLEYDKRLKEHERKEQKEQEEQEKLEKEKLEQEKLEQEQKEKEKIDKSIIKIKERIKEKIKKNSLIKIDNNSDITEDHKKILEKYGLENADFELQKEVILASHSCEMRTPLSSLTNCEPIRRIIQTLALQKLHAIKEKAEVRKKELDEEKKKREDEKKRKDIDESINKLKNMQTRNIEKSKALLKDIAEFYEKIRLEKLAILDINDTLSRLKGLTPSNDINDEIKEMTLRLESSTFNVTQYEKKLEEIKQLHERMNESIELDETKLEKMKEEEKKQEEKEKQEEKQRKEQEEKQQEEKEKKEREEKEKKEQEEKEKKEREEKDKKEQEEKKEKELLTKTELERKEQAIEEDAKNKKKQEEEKKKEQNKKRQSIVNAELEKKKLSAQLATEAKKSKESKELIKDQLLNKKYNIKNSLGNGNCFYSSIFRAAFEQNIIYNIEHNIKFVNSSYDINIHESAFILHIRNIIANKMMTDTYNEIVNIQFESISTIKNATKYNTIMNEYPTQLKTTYPTFDTFPKEFTEFKKYFAELVRQNYTYSSAIDVTIVTLILKNCGINLYNFNKNELIYNNIKQVKEGSTLNNSIIIEYNGTNHYNFYSFYNSPIQLNILDDNTIYVAKGGFRKTHKKNKKKRNTRKK